MTVIVSDKLEKAIITGTFMEALEKKLDNEMKTKKNIE